MLIKIQEELQEDRLLITIQEEDLQTVEEALIMEELTELTADLLQLQEV